LRAVEIITKKRSGQELSDAEIRFLIDGYVAGDIPDYQVSAWAMAVYFQGMTFPETGSLTRAMIASGDVLHLDGVPGPLVDKHSTGGVGDKISLVLAPLAAACGLRVPMMSGRALGHTGGTLDKLDAIPGFKTALTQEKIREGLTSVGYIMTGQSGEVVPADRLLYALRDVSGTVESIPLITASILSKKFAEGAEALVFDVKSGRGAFMDTVEKGRALAVSLVETARSLGRRAVAVLTDMGQPLGRMTGNFLEVEESVLCLRGQGPEDLMTLTYRQAAWMLVAGGLVKTVAEGETLARRKLEDGSALRKWDESVAFQGGNVAALNAQIGVRRARLSGVLTAPGDGWHGGWDALECGLAATALGAGRNKKEDEVLPDVGLEFLRKKGESVKRGQEVLRVWADSEAKLGETLSRLQKAWTLAAHRPAAEPLVIEEVTAL
jgi:pyrimidine-nucleoside phosphorylase